LKLNAKCNIACSTEETNKESGDLFIVPGRSSSEADANSTANDSSLLPSSESTPQVSPSSADGGDIARKMGKLGELVTSM
jgi:hypothetical protein